jgi:hypothetical protein
MAFYRLYAAKAAFDIASSARAEEKDQHEHNSGLVQGYIC